jgi:hypothetical protein
VVFIQDFSSTTNAKNQEARIEELRQKLGYPLKERDKQGSDFWYLRPGSDASEAENTCPIAVGFSPDLNNATEKELVS